MPPLHFIDSTLRDGEQTPGVRFSLTEKLEIAHALDQAGIPEIEAGIPAMGGTMLEEVRQVVAAPLNAEVSVWCRARLKDLEQAERCGARRVHIALPASDRLLAAMGKDLNWLLRRATSLPAIAKRRFEYVSVGLMDASRCSAERLHSLTGRVYRTGADRLRLADTVGVWNPFEVDRLFRDLCCRHPGMPFGFHGHNDLGMATANALSAVRAGAAWVDVTVNGLGDRAGNVPLAELALAVEHSLKRSSGIHLDQLNALSERVARACGQPLPADKPVVGTRVFRHEAGIHVHGLLRDRLSFQPFLPESVGRGQETLELGPHSGRTARQNLNPTPERSLI